MHSSYQRLALRAIVEFVAGKPEPRQCQQDSCQAVDAVPLPVSLMPLSHTTIFLFTCAWRPCLQHSKRRLRDFHALHQTSVPVTQAGSDAQKMPTLHDKPMFYVSSASHAPARAWHMIVCLVCSGAQLTSDPRRHGTDPCCVDCMRLNSITQLASPVSYVLVYTHTHTQGSGQHNPRSRSRMSDGRLPGVVWCSAYIRFAQARHGPLLCVLHALMHCD